jgi:death-on-curing protein
MSNGGTEPLFLTRGQVLAYHHQQIELFGGAHGVIDEGLLDSALNQPQTTWCYNPAADFFDLAAAYAFHLSKNHAFRDGNKRVALHSALAFLRVNGFKIVATESEMFENMSQLVTDVIDKPKFATFLRAHGVAV